MIPYGRQTISKKDIAAVVKVLKSAWLTQGPEVPRFEEALCRYTGAKYAVAVSSGTAALHLAVLALGVKPGGEVITTPISFVATSNSVLYAGARPVFADIDPHDANLDPKEAARRVTGKTQGIIPVHFGGRPVDLPAFQKLAKAKKLFILEDGCHALGADYKVGGKTYKVGSCSHSDAVIFSFHPVKSIATGEGGAILTNRKDVYDTLIRLRTHGITKDTSRFKNKAARTHAWYYEMHSLGFNYRMADVQAALGRSQLASLPAFMRKRRAIAAYYDKAFKGFPAFELPPPEKAMHSAWHLYALRLNLKKLTAGRAEIFDALRKTGLGVQVHYIPIHTQPYYHSLGFRSGQFPKAESYYERVVSLPIFPGLTPAQIKKTAKIVLRVTGSFLKKHL